MRWVVVKLANLFFVLVIVTFLVAAIFTGPLAERQRLMIEDQVRQTITKQFQNQPRVLVLKVCIQTAGSSAFEQSVDEQASRLIDNVEKLLSGQGATQTTTTTSNNTTTTGQIIIPVEDVVKVASALKKYSPEQRRKIILAVAEAMKKYAPTVSSDDALINQVVSAAKQSLAAEGIKVSDDVLKKIASSLLTSASNSCKGKIIQVEVQKRVHRQGLDKPWYVLSMKYTKMLLLWKPLQATSLSTQYWPYQGDRNALHIILERLPYSVSLFTTSSILTLLIAIPMALYAARRPGGILDNTITAWSVFSVSMPWWWLAMVFIYLLTIKFKVFPSPYETNIDWRDIVSVAKAAALPVFTVTILSIGDTAYRIRNILLDVFNEDFVTVARAKGVPEHLVLRKHVMRPAAPPLVTIVLFGIVLSIFSGAIITELIFNWFGLGRLYWEAIEQNDVPVIIELTYVSTVLYLVLRFLLDILYTLLDPRIRRA